MAGTGRPSCSAWPRKPRKLLVKVSGSGNSREHSLRRLACITCDGKIEGGERKRSQKIIEARLAAVSDSQMKDQMAATEVFNEDLKKASVMKDCDGLRLSREAKPWKPCR